MQDQRVVVMNEATAITPFWQRIPRFFLFPCHVEPLAYTALLSAASLLGQFVPLVPDIVGVVLVEFAIWLAATRYAFRVLEQTSQGFLTPDQYQPMPDPERSGLPYKMFGILLVWGIITGLVGAVSPVLGMIVMVFTTLALPASIMSLAVTNSFGQGLNPALWVSLMRTIGKTYFALWFFLFLLSSGAPIALNLLEPMLGGWLTLPLINFAFLYFNLVMFNMMGYCLYQYHHELGLDVKVDFTNARDGRGGAARKRPPIDPTGNEIAARVAAGDLDGALGLAYEQQRLEPDNVTAQERYHKLLLLGDKPKLTISHAKRLITLLLSKQQGERAVEVFKTMRGLAKDFEPAAPGEVVKLAQAARRRHDYHFALLLLRGFDQSHPMHADAPAAELLSAQILCENLKKDDLARMVLDGLISKHPDHSLAAEAGAYLKVLDRVRDA